jgi:hypothetical protein
LSRLVAAEEELLSCPESILLLILSNSDIKVRKVFWLSRGKLLISRLKGTVA